MSEYCYPHPRPEVAVDCVVFGVSLGEREPERALQVLLIQRGEEGRPFLGAWALPGRVVRTADSLERTAQDALRKAGFGRVYLEQLFTFGEPDRDPSGRVISVAYYALVRADTFTLSPGRGGANSRWVSVQEALGMELAYDHGEVLRMALRRLRGKLTYEPIGFELLPREFTLAELQGLYEAVLGTRLDKRNFWSKIQRMGVLEEVGTRKPEGRGRPARLFRFDERRYRELMEQGFSFEI